MEHQLPKLSVVGLSLLLFPKDNIGNLVNGVVVQQELMACCAHGLDFVRCQCIHVAHECRDIAGLAPESETIGFSDSTHVGIGIGSQ